MDAELSINVWCFLLGLFIYQFLSRKHDYEHAVRLSIISLASMAFILWKTGYFE